MTEQGLCLEQWHTRSTYRVWSAKVLHVCGKGAGHSGDHECTMCDATQPVARPAS